MSWTAAGAGVVVTVAIGAALIRARPLTLGVVVESEPTGAGGGWWAGSHRLREAARVVAALVTGLAVVTSPLVVSAVAVITLGLVVGRRRAAARSEHERSQLDAIDAMTMLDVCLSAGLGLRESVIELDRLGAGPVWRVPAAALGRGAPFEAAMTRLGAAAPALSRSADAMARAHRDGASVRSMVRGHRDDLVARRRTELSERSQRLGVLVLLPLTVCILPALVLAVVVPIAADSLTGLSFPL